MTITKAAAYLRLSREDGDKIESDSIANQRSLIKDYLKNKPDMVLVDEFSDEGYSGTSFDRPSLRRMIEDAKKKQINTIIVKDTSRLGRDYIEVGDYMEQIFPLLGVRFIAVNSNYDSDNYKNTTLGFETSIMNLVNAEYSKDLSRKVKSAHHTLWSQGV